MKKAAVLADHNNDSEAADKEAVARKPGMNFSCRKIELDERISTI